MKSLKRKIRSALLVATVIALLLVNTGCDSTSQLKNNGNVATSGNLAPAFKLTDTRGTTYDLSSLRGKKVYIEFWGTWCSVCMANIAEVNNTYIKFSTRKDIVFLTIASPYASGEKSPEDLTSWYNSTIYRFPVLLDNNGVIANAYGIRAYPTSVFINTKGEIVKQSPGAMTTANFTQIIASIK